MRLLKCCFLSFIYLLVWHAKLWGASDVFVMSCQLEPEAPLYSELEQLYAASFTDLNLPFRMQAMPVLRSITDVERARVGGNCLRIEDLLERGPYSNLVLVNMPLVAISFDVWVLSDGVDYPNFSDIVARGGLVGFERGVWIVERKLSALVPSKQLVVVADAKSGVEMLAAKRISAFVHSETKIAEAVVVAQKRRSVNVRRSGTLVSAELFPVLNEQYRELAPKLARALKANLEKICVQEAATQLPILCEYYRINAERELIP